MELSQRSWLNYFHDNVTNGVQSERGDNNLNAKTIVAAMAKPEEDCRATALLVVALLPTSSADEGLFEGWEPLDASGARGTAAVGEFVGDDSTEEDPPSSARVDDSHSSNPAYSNATFLRKRMQRNEKLVPAIYRRFLYDETAPSTRLTKSIHTPSYYTHCSHQSKGAVFAPLHDEGIEVIIPVLR